MPFLEILSFQVNPFCLWRIAITFNITLTFTISSRKHKDNFLLLHMSFNASIIIDIIHLFLLLTVWFSSDTDSLYHLRNFEMPFSLIFFQFLNKCNLVHKIILFIWLSRLPSHFIVPFL